MDNPSHLRVVRSNTWKFQSNSSYHADHPYPWDKSLCIQSLLTQVPRIQTEDRMTIPKHEKRSIFIEEYTAHSPTKVGMGFKKYRKKQWSSLTEYQELNRT